MRCKVCGAPSGKYPLCRACNIKKDKGQIIKCIKCGTWHYTSAPCSTTITQANNDKFLYEPQKNLISKSEQNFYIVIKSVLPNGYYIFPQINLATFINRTDNAPFHNELFRNVDFLITDAEYTPKFIIEINDQTHLNSDRKERDEKVQRICEEAGIPILKLWTSYGVNPEYIKRRIDEILLALPATRIHHFNQPRQDTSSMPPFFTNPPAFLVNQKKGCYIATCIYGSYDCPPVWLFRRYRDFVLSETWYGRVFICIYYAISPKIVEKFGAKKWFKDICKKLLDKLIVTLQSKGFEDTPYNDKHW